MIGWFVPHSVFPDGYHCDPKQPVPFAGLASQKNYMSLYLMCVYGDEKQRKWFEAAWKKSGKKLDMGKSCVRFKKVEDLPLEVITEAVSRVSVKDFLGHYTSVVARPGGKRAASAAKKKGVKKTVARKKTVRKAAKKTAGRKTAARKRTTKARPARKR